MPLFGIKGMLIMGAVMATMTGGFYWYYKDTQSRMALLTQNNAKLETAVQINEQTISSLKVDYERANAELNRINNEFQTIREQNRELSNRLARHDLGVLGSEKPDLVQRIINGASEKVGRCFELLSGAPLTDKEKEAKSDKEFNSECPWLYNDLVTR
jgi:chromosome segregation ATPase